MTRAEHLLTILAEECAEVAQRVSKALRFGLAEVEPGQEKTNARRIAGEINDLVAVYQMLAGPVVSPTTPLFAYGTTDDYMRDIGDKQAKVERYLAYSAECGTMGPNFRFQQAGDAPFGTVKPCVVREVIREPKFTVLVCVEDGKPEVGYICVFRPDEVTAEVGDCGTLTFTKGGRTGGFWVFKRPQ